MSKTILTQVSGFTPVIDGIVRDTDLQTALVFGMVWRFCQMDSGECYASLQKIANRLGVSRSTVQRRIKALVQRGYLQDLTPHMRHSPHTYIDTGRAGLRSSVEASVTDDEEVLDQNHPHTAYKSKDMANTLENVADDLYDKGVLTPELLKILEDKLNPVPASKEKTNWNDQIDLIQAGRSA